MFLKHFLHNFDAKWCQKPGINTKFNHRRIGASHRGKPTRVTRQDIQFCDPKTEEGSAENKVDFSLVEIKQRH